MTSPWFDTAPAGARTQERERSQPPPGVDFGPSALAHQPADSLSSLSLLARDMPPRDYDDILRRAVEVGARLGSILDPTGEGTAAYYLWYAKNRNGTKSAITGPTVGMMDELARVWGRIVYRTQILSAEGQRVHLRGQAVDLTNGVAHERDHVAHLRPPPASFKGRHDEEERWKTMQLQSASSKAVRGVLEHVVPKWVQDAALEAARDAAAQARTGGVSLPEAIRRTLEAFAKLGAERDDVVRWAGGDTPTWTGAHLQELRGLYQRLKRGELSAAGLYAESVERAAERDVDADTPADSKPPADEGDRLAGLGLQSPDKPKADEEIKPDKPVKKAADDVKPDQELKRDALWGQINNLKAKVGDDRYRDVLFGIQIRSLQRNAKIEKLEAARDALAKEAKQVEEEAEDEEAEQMAKLRVVVDALVEEAGEHTVASVRTRLKLGKNFDDYTAQQLIDIAEALEARIEQKRGGS